MISNEDIIKLQLVKGMGRKTLSKILNYIDIKDIELNNFFEIIKYIEKLGVKNIKIDLEKIEEEAEVIINLCRKHKIKIISIFDEEYPDKLRIIEDKPIILYVDGNEKLLKHSNNIAIVGTRKPSEKGYEISSIFAERLAEEHCCVVSGFASGCDEAAHKGCLAAKGATIAVIPSGHRTIPKGNNLMYNMILINGGAVISELPPNAKPEKHTFIDRNRIIAALSDGVIVIEGGKGGGTSHTVKFAINYDKPVAYTTNIPAIYDVEKNLIENEIVIIDNFEKLVNFKNKSFEKVLDKAL